MSLVSRHEDGARLCAYLAGAPKFFKQAIRAELAAEIGSDVPFFLGGPAAICRGRGERDQDRRA